MITSIVRLVWGGGSRIKVMAVENEVMNNSVNE